MQITICDKCPCLGDGTRVTYICGNKADVIDNLVLTKTGGRKRIASLDLGSAYSKNCRLESIKHDGKEFIPERREI